MLKICVLNVLKSSLRPARGVTPIRFKLKGREKQIEFLRRRFNMGEAAFFLLQVGEYSERRLYLAPGNCGEDLQSGLTESEVAVSCLNGGLVFPTNANQLEIIRGVLTCCKRRASHFRK